MNKIINAQIILCKCAKKHGLFGMRTEEARNQKWNVNWAFPLNEKRAKSEKFDTTKINGSFTTTKEYPGCPYCGNKEFFMCGTCGKITCWDGVTIEVTCAHCGTTEKIDGVITQLYTGEDV